MLRFAAAFALLEGQDAYTIGGYMAGGLDRIAPMVDGVLGQQLDGLKAAAEAPPAK